MREQILIIGLLISVFSLQAQVGIGTTSPDASSALDITSTDSGLLIPRMTQAQRDAISTPAEGLLIYQTDNTKGFYKYDGTSWTAFGDSDSNWIVSGNDIHNSNSGNVGIGTTAPASRLHIESSIAPIVTVQSTTAGNGSFTQWYDGDGDVRGIVGADGVGYSGTADQFTIGTWSDHPIDFRTNTASRMHITNVGNIGIGTTTPNASSALDITSTDSGLLIPRMTEVQRDAISTPAEGLLIYQTDNTKGFYKYDGTSWTAFGGSDSNWTVSGNDIHNSNSGNVGINTDIPNALLGIGAPLNNENIISAYSNKITTTTPAVTMISQSNGSSSKVNNSIDYGKSQTFTPQVSGQLTELTIKLWVDDGTYSLDFDLGNDQDINLTIQDITAGTSLHTQTIQNANLREDYWEFLTFSIPNVEVIAGNTHRITIRNNEDGGRESNTFIQFAAGNPYPDGSFNNDPNSDIYFRIKIQEPDVTNTSQEELFVLNEFGHLSIGHNNPSATLDVKGTFESGDNTAASGTNAVAIGTSTTASGGSSTAMGSNTTASGGSSIAMGSSTIASGENSIAMGSSTIASGENSTAIGSSTTASGVNSTAMGSNTTALGENSTAMGINSNASGEISTAIGSDTIASELWAIALGASTQATGQGSFTTGVSTQASKYATTAMGSLTHADGYISTALGSETIASGDYSTALGVNTIAPSFGETVIGGYTADYAPISATEFNANDRLFSIGNGYYDISTSTATRSNALTLLKNGNMGLGTTTPTEKLDVDGFIKSNTALIDFGGLNNEYANFGHKDIATYGFLQHSGGEVYMNASNNTPLHLRTNGTDKLTILSNGNVGIGNTNPTQAKLVVNGSGATQTATYHFLHGGGGAGGPVSASTLTYSIYADDRIASPEFVAFSDERIKNIKGLSNTTIDLETLANIEVTNYTLKDSIAKGNKAYKKVIAQQVKEVFPQAVSNDLIKVIPNIYQLAEIHNGEIQLANNLQKGDKVKLIFTESEALVEVQEATANSFKVNLNKQGKVFVYGKQVNDFHTVDYEAIAMLNVSATQELLKRIKQLETEKESLTAKVIANENEFKAYKKQTELRLQDIENRLFNETAEN